MEGPPSPPAAQAEASEGLVPAAGLTVRPRLHPGPAAFRRGLSELLPGLEVPEQAFRARQSTVHACGTVFWVRFLSAGST